MNRRTFLTLAGTSLAGLALAGCGDDSDATPTSAPSGQQDEQDQAAQAAGQAQTHVVEMSDELKFDPEQLTINVGDTVTWRTVGVVPHTATCDPSKANNPDEHVQLPAGAEPWDSGTVRKGEEFSHAFEVAGEYTYFCVPHEAAGMVGRLSVQAA